MLGTISHDNMYNRCISSHENLGVHFFAREPWGAFLRTRTLGCISSNENIGVHFFAQERISPANRLGAKFEREIGEWKTWCYARQLGLETSVKEIQVSDSLS